MQPGKMSLSCQDCSEGRVSDALVCVPSAQCPQHSARISSCLHNVISVSCPDAFSLLFQLYMLFLYLYAVFMGRLLILFGLNLSHQTFSLLVPLKNHSHQMKCVETWPSPS